LLNISCSDNSYVFLPTEMYLIINPKKRMWTTQYKGKRIQKEQNQDTQKTTSTNNLQCFNE